MKTIIEQNFDIVFKDIFQQFLKPLGFKKKGNNFYLFSKGIGKMVNIQKSSFYSKEHIHFTINVGIFSPEYWNSYYNYSNRLIPDFPTEPECLIRKRIGKLLNKTDIWYDIKEDTNIDLLKNTQVYNFTQIILPYFDKINSNEELLTYLLEVGSSDNSLSRLIILSEAGRVDEAKQEIERLLNETASEHLKKRIRETAQKYSLM